MRRLTQQQQFYAVHRDHGKILGLYIWRPLCLDGHLRMLPPHGGLENDGRCEMTSIDRPCIPASTGSTPHWSVDSAATVAVTLRV